MEQLGRPDLEARLVQEVFKDRKAMLDQKGQLESKDRQALLALLAYVDLQDATDHPDHQAIEA